MCGLVALYNASMTLNGMREKLTQALATLTHRGPNEQGYWFNEKAEIGLGHARLAIVDVTNGQQPLASADGLVQVIVNGEFYDYQSLRNTLIQRGHIFRTRSDSELLIHLYEEHDVDCLEHLRGEFAFVLWDQRRARLFAARDRFGIKPLVFTQTQKNELMIASEAKALFAMGIKANWNHHAFQHVASHQYLSPAQTLFSGVHMLRPGHYLLAEKGGWHDTSYWQLNYPKINTNSINTTERSQKKYIEQIRFLLDESVRERIQGEFPVACYLSSGIDSSAIAALVSRYSHTPLTCFGISFDEQAYDESQLAANFASEIGANFQPVAVTIDSIIESLHQAVYYAEGLCINGQLSAKFLLSKAANAQGFKSVLVGEGADELFCGYSHLQRDYLLAQIKHGNNRAEKQLIALEANTKLQNGIMFSNQSTADIPTALAAKIETGLRMRPFLHPDFLHDNRKRDPVHELLNEASIAVECMGRDPVNQATILWIRTALAGYILKTLGDGTEMAHAIEGRVPYLDHKLFELVRNIPLQHKLQGGVAKHILRESLTSILPKALCQRPKRPLLAPPIAGKRESIGWTMALDLVHSDSFRSQPFWQTDCLAGWMSKLHKLSEAERRKADPIVMLALSTHELQTAFSLSDSA